MTVHSSNPSEPIGSYTVFDLFYALTVMLAFCVALGVGAFLGWLLIERDGAPFEHLRGDRRDD